MSIAKGSNVLMIDSSIRRIEDVCVGDIVRTPTGNAKVVNIFSGIVQDVIRIEAGDSYIITDTTHPFITAEDKIVKAKDLKPKDILKMMGEHHQIISISMDLMIIKCIPSVLRDIHLLQTHSLLVIS